jgi:hypothetical protein
MYLLYFPLHFPLIFFSSFLYFYCLYLCVRIPFAQSAQYPPFPIFQAQEKDIEKYEIEPGFYVIGDHRSSPTLHGAIQSGRIVANQILQTK